MARPNVLLIAVDRWPGRPNYTLERPFIMTPTLNHLAASGVVYTNAYSTTPMCIPARRELMTGTSSRTHRDRVGNETLPMPKLPNMAQTFVDAGYQAYAVGKLHVYPQRDRAGFQEAIINEEGRHHLGMRADDHELDLAKEGYAGQGWAHGLGNNVHYMVRPWHLPEHLHPIDWTAREMSEVIARRNPSRPAFWYMSFSQPHPPLIPLQGYLDQYQQLDVPMPFYGEWAEDGADVPHALRWKRHRRLTDDEIRLGRQATYAMCTHIDHQIRMVIGLLREEGVLDDTIILITGDHGEMLGNHGIFGIGDFFDDSAKVHMMLVPPPSYTEIGFRRKDDRLAVLADVMPTLLEMCDIPVPTSVEGLSLIGDGRRDFVYGEFMEDDRATRMVHDGRYKLIYYPVGNRSQLFDLELDPDETHDLSGNGANGEAQERLTRLLVENMYGSDLDWLDGDGLVGLPDRVPKHEPDPGLRKQRGLRFM